MASSENNLPRVWKVNLQGEGSTISEILTFPTVYLEGSYNEVFGLIYGYAPDVLMGLTQQLGIEDAKVGEVLPNPRVLRPLDKLSLSSMPIQDAIDLAVFLAKVQVEMDRFLPGQPACVGPIDVMVLRTVPNRDILVLPGKTVRHPDLGRTS
jgi:hypothetical protein